VLASGAVVSVFFADHDGSIVDGSADMHRLAGSASPQRIPTDGTAKLVID
jgi:hypothetical protein